ncbi:hypothetical protein HC000_02135 [Pseudoalteromonas sp. MIP2626]|uniref:hypothetical protein n=1 Tax=Pseudoalteromonas sp. MIP2626 TaxID=2705464 RepID=UPI0015C6F9A1|nr:hypothetical protein [Pseudoalteromonas sp. MIP2626]NYR11299.1 hypothetical protein [Pseudoalteromonas sp. MIP2626]
MSVQNIADSATSILKQIIEVAAAHNETVDEFNMAIDRIEELEAECTKLRIENLTIVELKAQIDDMQAVINKKNATLNKQSDVIDKAIEHKGIDRAEVQKLRAELKLLQQLDPKRLEKVNKTQKAKIAELKADVEAARKQKVEAMKNATELARKMKAEGYAPFYVDPVTGNSIRMIPHMFVNKDNGFGGIAHTPVLEFHHRERGITRQGILTASGDVNWAMASNSSPTELDSQIAKDHILDYCQRNKVATKFIKEIKKAA